MKSVITGIKKLEMYEGEMIFSIYAHVLERLKWDWTNISVSLNNDVIAIGYFKNRKVVIEKKIGFVIAHYVKEVEWKRVSAVPLRFYPNDIVQLSRLLKEEMEDSLNRVETTHALL
ncbi:hypothetical protein OCA22_30910 [Bacillus cereus]|nr:hypothetical protein [Bacillus cereus]